MNLNVNEKINDASISLSNFTLTTTTTPAPSVINTSVWFETLSASTISFSPAIPCLASSTLIFYSHEQAVLSVSGASVGIGAPSSDQCSDLLFIDCRSSATAAGRAVGADPGGSVAALILEAGAFNPVCYIRRFGSNF
jgi:hypothetical protein